MAVVQNELFQLDSPLLGEIRGERSLMAFPFFALAKNAWMKPLAYSTPDDRGAAQRAGRGHHL
ncbi:hypothetical protein [Sphingobium sp.]|uniref:hypothetical protein n=1 Tax=Sphingobium sp. TaxID=1912891 RepID=UPI003459A7A4